jgi:hypothetical protein
MILLISLLLLWRSTKLGTMSRAVAYSPDGTLLAVGIGGRVGIASNRDDGKWMVLRESDLEKVHEAQPSARWISDIKFSPDGSILGVASHDAKVTVVSLRSACYPFQFVFLVHACFSSL